MQGGVVSDPMKVVKLGLLGRMSYAAVVKFSVVVASPSPRTSQYFSSCLSESTVGQDRAGCGEGKGTVSACNEIELSSWRRVGTLRQPAPAACDAKENRRGNIYCT